MPNILADHGLSVCDTVCSYFDIWKKTVINVLNKNNIDLSSVGFLNELLESYFKQRIDFILYCYGQNKVETLKIMNRKRRGSIILQRVNQVLLNWKIHHQLVTYLSSHFHLVDIIYQSSSIHYSFYAPTHKSNSFIWSLISISFILQITVRLIHIQHIWFCSHCIVFQPHCVFHFF